MKIEFGVSDLMTKTKKVSGFHRVEKADEKQATKLLGFSNVVTMREEHIKFMSKRLLSVDFTKVNVRWLRNLVEKKVMEHFSLEDYISYTECYKGIVTKQNKIILSSYINIAEKRVYVFIDYCYFPYLTDEVFPLNSFEITVDDIPII